VPSQPFCRAHAPQRARPFAWPQVKYHGFLGAFRQLSMNLAAADVSPRSLRRRWRNPERGGRKPTRPSPVGSGRIVGVEVARLRWTRDDAKRASKELAAGVPVWVDPERLSLDEYLDSSPDATREQAVAVLEYAQRPVDGQGSNALGNHLSFRAPPMPEKTFSPMPKQHPFKQNQLCSDNRPILT